MDLHPFPSSPFPFPPMIVPTPLAGAPAKPRGRFTTGEASTIAFYGPIAKWRIRDTRGGRLARRRGL